MTSAFGGQRSIQLSYGCVGADLATAVLSGKASRNASSASCSCVLGPSRRSSRRGRTRCRSSLPRAPSAAARCGRARREVEQRHCERSVMALAADVPAARCRAGRGRTGPRSARARRDRAGARPRSPNPRARRSGALRRLPGRAARTRRTCVTVRSGSSDQKLPAALPSASAPRLAARALRVAPHVLQRGARRVGISDEMPRRRERHDALASARGWRRRSPSSRRGNSRPARRARRCCAASGSSRCSTWPATSSSDRSRRLAPVEQQRAAAHPRDRARPATPPRRGRGCAAD